MKKQTDLYEALIEADHICDVSGLDQTISDISGNICTIAEVAQQGIMHPDFAPTALIVIAQFAALSDEQAEDIGNVFKSIREKITCGLSEPEPQHVEGEGF